MTFLARSFVLSLSLMGSYAHGADPAFTFGKPDCRIGRLMGLSPGHAVSWTGGCKDSYADGKGVLEWQTENRSPWKLEATLVRGEIVGEATLVFNSGRYIGTFRNGVPNGSGYFEYPRAGARYRGEVVNARFEGKGLFVARDGSTYQGEWKASARHGRGKAVFALGGSYDGEWRNGRFHGEGTLVYNSGRSVTGTFVNGRALGAASVSEGDDERFGPNDDSSAGDSQLRRARARPSSASWQELTREQQALVRSAYPALDDGDEPPYPLTGTRALYRKAADLYEKFTDYQGMVLVHVTVGADGMPTSVGTSRIQHQEFARQLEIFLMQQRFKPALCAGKPCSMIYPMEFLFSSG